MPEPTQKQIHEMEIFSSFASCLNKDTVYSFRIDLASARNEEEPLPDISCNLNGQSHYFELGRVVDEGLAKSRAHSLKTGEPTRGAFLQDEILIGILDKKIKKVYPVAKDTLDLLVYWDEQVPSVRALTQDTKGKVCLYVLDMLTVGNWNRIWFYDHNSLKIVNFYPKPGRLGCA